MVVANTKAHREGEDHNKQGQTTSATVHDGFNHGELVFYLVVLPGFVGNPLIDMTELSLSVVESGLNCSIAWEVFWGLIKGGNHGVFEIHFEVLHSTKGLLLDAGDGEEVRSKLAV